MENTNLALTGVRKSLTLILKKCIIETPTLSMEKLMKTIIHVNQHVIRRNTKTGDDKPCLTVKTYKSNNYGHEAHIKDSEGNVVAKIVYSPHKPLSCGARCWIETENEVETIVREDPTTLVSME